MATPPDDRSPDRDRPPRTRRLVPRLIARRQIWWPTAAGGVLLLGTAALLATLAVRAAYPWLAVTELAQGPDHGGARTLVVEGWLDAPELDQVAPFLRGHRYERVLTTGGPTLVWGEEQRTVSSADRAARYLRRHGVGGMGGVGGTSGASGVPVIAVPAPASAQDRTFLSAVMVREWAAQTGTRLDAIDVYTAGVHARRSRTAYRLALGPAVEVGIVAATPPDFDTARWWHSSAGAKSVVSEAVSVAWTACCFWPPAPGSHEERWAVPPPASAAPPAPP